VSFARSEDATEAAIAAWVAAQPADLPVHRGCGYAYHDTIGHAAARSSAWDGPLVARCNLFDWLNAAMGEWRSPHRLGVDGDRRYVDYSDLIPESTRTLRLFADARIPPGHCVVETPDGRALARVIW
jgi:hypothetical protein